MTKTFERSFLCVEDTGGDFWAFHNHAMHHISNGDGGIHCHDIDHGIDLLKSSGHITETPLEKATKAVDNTLWNALSLEGCKSYAREIVNTLEKELREELS